MPNKIDLHELSACLACIGTVGSDKPCESCPYYRGDDLECCDIVIADAKTVIDCLIKREEVDHRDR